MPPHVGDIGGVGDLLQRLLHLVFAEVAMAGGVGGADAVLPKGLRDVDEGDVGRVAPGPPGGVRDALADSRQPDGDVGIEAGQAFVLRLPASAKATAGPPKRFARRRKGLRYFLICARIPLACSAY